MSVVASQTDAIWDKAFGGSDADYGESVKPTNDGGYIIAGYTKSIGNGGSDAWLIRTDSNGNELWNQTYGSSDDERAYDIKLTDDGGYIIAGLAYPDGQNYEFYLLKVDSNGNQEWSNSFDVNNGFARSLALTYDGGYLMLGYSDFDLCIIKTDSNGNLQFNQTYGGSSRDEGYSIKRTPDGGFILAGQITNQSGTGKDAILMKTDTLGDTLWTKTYGGTKDEIFNSIALTVDGGYIMTGSTSSYGSGKKDTYTVKTNNSGDTLWTFIKGDADDDIANKIIQVSDTGYAIIGTHKSFVPGWKKDFYFISNRKRIIRQKNR